ncbi:hypothetical protein GKZ68_20500 (plasmid) [Hymenobacter sp. BRD128]|uniref:hypothetical protein n=1 Tax=Hymenobacter sp. BRD128 TaxID=2675878 RepID=UPI0015669F5E|nr:hypothetical protein [Hymenobacter sp. BRD128]QKG59065.1 hypothetical protein GKZ68_20500 [Hymenobacter sp. BRD128]
MSTLVELTRWYGPNWRGYAPQAVPAASELTQAGAVATGECLPDYGDEVEALPPERDNRTWYVESPRGTIILLLVPDRRGFYLEDEYGDRWRPANLAELLALLREMEAAPAWPVLQPADLQPTS